MIYHFGDLPKNVLGQAGGKGGSLARLYQAGYSVPEGVVILPEAFGEGEGLKAVAWEELKGKLAEMRNGELKKETPKGVTTNGVAFAVRSSAVNEDSTHASFAGEFETVLDVRGDGEIKAAIEAVRRSRQSERVEAYSRAMGLAGEGDKETRGQGDKEKTGSQEVDRASQQEMAVVVQRLVRAEYAGVLFTADPLTGSYQQMIGNFVSGLGDRLVSGEADGETFSLERPSGRYSGPAVMKRYGKQLFKLAARLEEELGGPQDIEWAAARGKVYLLQARPVTTLQAYNPTTGEWNDSLGGDYCWTNTNFGEAVPDVMTPLTWSLLQLLAQEMFPLPIPGRFPLMGNIGGRFYMNRSLMASLFKALGMSEERLAYESEEVFGSLPQGLEVPLIPFSRWGLLRRVLLPSLRQRQRVMARRKVVGEFIAQIPGRCTHLVARIEGAGTAADLLAVWQEGLEPAVREACQMLQAGTSAYEDLARPLRRELSELVGTADSNSLMSGLNGQAGALASLGPVLGLWRVAQGQLSKEAYRQQYGHRGVHEFELSRPRPAEEPAWLEKQLAGLVDTNVEMLLGQQQAEQAAAWNRFVEKYPGKAKKMEARLAAAAEAGRGREGVRSEVVRVWGVVRAYALSAGEVTALGDDVFFLTAGEIAGLLAGKPVPVVEMAVRRAAYERFSALPPYPALINGRFEPVKWAADPNRRGDVFDSHQEAVVPAKMDGTTIKGFAGAAGIVEGVVRRLDAAEEGHLLQKGEILVAATTNIGWTPLFPRAAAVVTDVGAPLSHAAIVARELGIPAVVGCGTATMRLKTGDRVRVNGGAGVVEILEENRTQMGADFAD